MITPDLRPVKFEADEKVPNPFFDPDGPMSMKDSPFLPNHRVTTKQKTITKPYAGIGNFHAWASCGTEGETYPVGIVEGEDGRVYECDVDKIQFLDRKMLFEHLERGKSDENNK